MNHNQLRNWENLHINAMRTSLTECRFGFPGHGRKNQQTPLCCKLFWGTSPNISVPARFQNIVGNVSDCINTLIITLSYFIKWKQKTYHHGTGPNAYHHALQRQGSYLTTETSVSAVLINIHRNALWVLPHSKKHALRRVFTEKHEKTKIKIKIRSNFL